MLDRVDMNQGRLSIVGLTSGALIAAGLTVLTPEVTAAKPRTQVSSQTQRVQGGARHDGIGIVVASVDQGFSHDSRGAFDPEYMKALFELGFEQGNKTALRVEPVSAPVQERGQDFSPQKGPKP